MGLNNRVCSAESSVFEYVLCQHSAIISSKIVCTIDMQFIYWILNMCSAAKFGLSLTTSLILKGVWFA